MSDYLYALSKALRPTLWQRLRYRLSPRRGMQVVALSEVRNLRQFRCWVRGCEVPVQFCTRCGVFVP